MNTQELYDELATSLASRGLPVEYAQRTATEMADHHSDLVEELEAAGKSESAALQEADSRFGDRKAIVKKAVREYQSRHWYGRWPILTFVVGPWALLLAIWFASMFLMMTIGRLFEPSWDGTTDLRYADFLLLKAWIVFLAPVLVIYLLAKLSSRAAMARRWTLISATMVAIVVGTMPIMERQSPLTNEATTGSQLIEQASRHEIVIGVPFASLYFVDWDWNAVSLSLLCQFLLPVTIAVVFLWRTHQLAGRNQLEIATHI